MIRNHASNPGAVIIDGHGRADLGVIRALGQQEVPIYLLTDDRRSAACYSRYVTRILPLPPRDAAPERLRALLDYGEQFRHKPVFFSTGDGSMIFFSRHRALLEKYYRHHLSDPELIEALYDKIRFAELSRRHGLDVPFTLAPANLTELEAALPRFSFPVMVKPAEKRRWARHREVAALTGGNLKGVRLESPKALLAFYRRVARYDSRVVIQDYIEGRDEQIYSLHAYIGRHGLLLGHLVGQKLRTYPVHRGIGCFVRSVEEPAVTEVALRALRGLNYTGHASVQLKRLPDGRFKILEIGSRYSSWAGLHPAASVNLAYAAYRESLGYAVPPLPAARPGARWIDAHNDLRALPEYRRLGEWTLGGWLRSYLGRNTYHYFSWRDPLPALVPHVKILPRLAAYPVRWTLRQLTPQRAAK